jgi:ribose-phosphate pyrophosphokinase
MDLHADQIMGFFDSQFVRVENLHVSSLLIHYFKDKLGKDSRIAAPDAGAAKRTQYLAKHLSKEMLMAYKRRNYEAKHQVDEMKILGVPGKDEVIIADDLVASGGTAITMIEKLKEKGVKKVAIACAHPMLIGKAIEKFDKIYHDKENPFYMLIGTDSIPHNKKLLSKPWYKEINTSKFVAKAIYEIHTSGSVSQLLAPNCVKELDLWVD